MKNMEFRTKRIGLNSYENIDCNTFHTLSLCGYIYTGIPSLFADEMRLKHVFIWTAEKQRM